MKDRKRSPRAYWLALAAVYGVSLSVFTTAPLVWAVAFAPAMIGFLAVHALYYGQAGRKKGGRFATATPGVGLLAATGGAAALLLRGTSAAYWAGPVLGLVGFAAAFFFLDRFGKFAPQAPEGSS